MRHATLAGRGKPWIIPCICLALSGCGSFFPLESASPSTAMSMLVHYGTVASFDCGNEKINVGSSEYGISGFVDVYGKKRDEQLSRLSIGVDGRPETYRDYWAYSGLIIYYYTYRIEILRIGRDLQNPFTELNVTYVEKADSVERNSYCIP
jgi:hypothetical protein